MTYYQVPLYVVLTEVQDGIVVPGVYGEQDFSQAAAGLPSGARKVIIIAQRIAAGTVAEKTVYRPFSDAEVAAKSGIGSVAHLMARAAFKRNPQVDLSIVTLDDNAGGVAAQGTFTFTGPATSAGTVRIFIGDQYVDVAIAAGDSATDIATAVKAAVNAKADFPATADNVAGVLTTTAKNKGKCGNEIGLGYQLSGAAGVTCTIVAMANGAADPNIADATDLLVGAKYDIYCTSLNDQPSLQSLRTHLNSISGPVAPKSAIAIYATTGAYASATSLANAVNVLREAAPWAPYTAATQKKTPSFMVAAIGAAAEVGRKIGTPTKNLDMTGVSAPDIADRPPWGQLQGAISNGVSPIVMGPGEKPQLIRMPTTYTSDANSQPVLVDLFKVTCMDAVRDALIANISAMAPDKIREKDEDHPLSTLDICKNIAKHTAYQCQKADWLTGVNQVENYFIVERDVQNRQQINYKVPSPVGDGAYVHALQIIMM